MEKKRIFLSIFLISISTYAASSNLIVTKNNFLKKESFKTNTTILKTIDQPEKESLFSVVSDLRNNYVIDNDDACKIVVTLTASENKIPNYKELCQECLESLKEMSADDQSWIVSTYLKNRKKIFSTKELEELAPTLRPENAFRLKAVSTMLKVRNRVKGANATVIPLMQQAKASNDELSQAYLAYAQTITAIRNQDAIQIRAHLNEAIRLANANQMAGLKIDIQKVMGSWLSTIGEFTLARELSQSALKELVKAEDLNNILEPCMNIGVALDRNPNTKLSDIVKLINEAEGDPIVQLCLNRAAGVIAFDSGDNDNTEKYIKEALRLAEEHNFTEIIPILLNRYALGAYGRGDYATAVTRYEEALKLFESSGKFGRVGVIYTNIAIIFHTLGDNERAIELFQQALDVYRTLDDGDYFIPTAMGNMAEAHAIEGRHKVAIKLFEEAVTINKKQPNRELDGALNFQYAKSLYALGKEQQAIDLAVLSVTQIREHRALSEVSEPLVWLAERYLERNNTKVAQEVLEEARIIMDPNNVGPEKMIKDSDNVNVYLEYTRSMAELMAAVGRPEKALRFSKVALNLSEKRFESDKVKAVGNFDILLKLRERDRDLREREKDLKVLQQENLVKDLSLSQARLRGIIAFAGAVLAGLLALLFYKSYCSEKKLVATKNVFLSEIHHRTKNNLQLLISLLSLDGHKKEKCASIVGGSNDAINRAKAMALVHDHIYNKPKSMQLEVKDFLDDLIRLLEKSQRQEGVRLIGDIGAVHIDIDKFTLLGLLVSELVTNAYKHAFMGSANGGTISISFRPEQGSLKLIVADNGRGFDPETGGIREGSMGRTLIEGLSEQLGGQHMVESGPNGTVWTISNIPMTSSLIAV